MESGRHCRNVCQLGGDAQKLLRMCVRSFGMSDMWGGGRGGG
jgi:hypothetical protein